MDRTTSGLVLMILAVPAMASGNAPLCIYGNGPPQCFYYDAQSCQSAAQTFRGICGPNTVQEQSQQPSAPQLQTPDYMGSIMRAGAEGQRRGLEQREANARLELIRAQTEAVRESTRQQQMAAQVQANTPLNTQTTTPLYRCPRDDGGLYYTATPYPGCVYLGTGN